MDYLSEVRARLKAMADSQTIEDAKREVNPVRPGQWNVERIDDDSIKGRDRLMLGVSTDADTAERYLAIYRERYRGMQFVLVSGAPAETTDIPFLWTWEPTPKGGSYMQ